MLGGVWNVWRSHRKTFFCQLSSISVVEYNIIFMYLFLKTYIYIFLLFPKCTSPYSFPFESLTLRSHLCATYIRCTQSYICYLLLLTFTKRLFPSQHLIENNIYSFTSNNKRKWFGLSFCYRPLYNVVNWAWLTRLKMNDQIPKNSALVFMWLGIGQDCVQFMEIVYSLPY